MRDTSLHVVGRNCERTTQVRLLSIAGRRTWTIHYSRTTLPEAELVETKSNGTFDVIELQGGWMHVRRKGQWKRRSV